jgi:hypothetical protein
VRANRTECSQVRAFGGRRVWRIATITNIKFAYLLLAASVFYANTVGVNPRGNARMAAGDLAGLRKAGRSFAPLFAMEALFWPSSFRLKVTGWLRLIAWSGFFPATWDG